MIKKPGPFLLALKKPSDEVVVPRAFAPKMADAEVVVPVLFRPDKSHDVAEGKATNK
jgi:hypothetical protein